MKQSSYQNQNILVLGLAKSGTEATKILLKLGAHVTVNDRTPIEDNEQAKQLQDEGAEVVCGSHPETLVHEGLDLMVKNPGIPYDHPLVLKALNMEIPVITEVEIADEIAVCDMIGITGSNGKTTTTTMTRAMLENSGRNPKAAGNIGEVATKVAYASLPEDIMVVELSSFQLQGTIHFKPEIAVFLNLIEAHLDYHGTMDEYAQAKARIFRNQTKDDVLIYNADDPLVSALAGEAPSTCIPFSTQRIVEGGSYIKDGDVVVLGEVLMRRDGFSLPGDYNLSNGLAAATAAMVAGADPEQVRYVLANFDGVKHRLQYVDTIREVRYYNNSKATNVPATVKALEAFPGEKIILIAGGLDRKLSFNDLHAPMGQSVKGLVTFGETADKLAEAGQLAGVETIRTVSTLQEAVNIAENISEKGDIILLSPACASWDQFRTFEERGDTFIQAVAALKEDNS